MIRFVDVCCGIGGFHLALQSVPSKCVLAIENDKHAVDTYNSNFPNTLIYNDLTQINPPNIPDHDLLCAGLPCQSYSTAGKRLNLNDPRGALFFALLNVLRCKRPPYVIIENVPGILRVINIIKEELGKIYDHISVLKLNSIDFRLAQSRERVFIVCSPTEFKFSYKQVDKGLPVKSVFEPTVSSRYYIYESCFHVPAQKLNFRKPLLVARFKIGQGYRIYSVEHPSITLTASGGGYAGKTGAYLTNDGVRKLTPKECLRLQGFHDNFILHGNPYKLLGNAVSVNVVRAIIGQLL